MSLRIHHALDGRSVEFRPTGDEVLMFVSGPVAYDDCHLGHAKTSTQFDFLARHLERRGHRVRYVQGLDDMGPLVVRRAAREGVPAAEWGRRCAAAFQEDMRALGNHRVDAYLSWRALAEDGAISGNPTESEVVRSAFGSRYTLHGRAAHPRQATAGKAVHVEYHVETALLKETPGGLFVPGTGLPLPVRDVLRTADVRTVRYLYLATHYRTALTCTVDALERSRHDRVRVEGFARRIEPTHRDSPQNAERAREAAARFSERLDDDLDTPGALAAVFGYLDRQDASGEPAGAAARALLEDVEEAFGAFVLPAWELPPAAGRTAVAPGPA